MRDRLIESWNDTNAYFDEKDVKRVYYLSLEYLMGRSMQNALLNMDLETNYRAALKEMGYALETMYEVQTGRLMQFIGVVVVVVVVGGSAPPH